MRVQGRENPDYSAFENPAPGWHNAVVQEGIDFLRKDGAEMVGAKGNKTILVNMLIDGGEDDGKKISQMCPYETEFGEQKLADLLVATGLAAKFEEKFPGDVSLFDPQVFQAIQLKLPKQFLQVFIEISKDGKYANIGSVAKMGVVPPDKKKGKGGGTVSPAKEAPKASTGSAGNGW
jgi:hypothetical protein